MDLRGRKLKLTAVAALVVLTLTGFSTGRHSGGTGSGGGGGGGCSSSGQDHDSSSSTSGGGTWSGSGHDDDDHDYDGSSGSGGYDDSYDDTGTGSGSDDGSGSGETLRDATAELVGCATEQDSYATVAVTNPNDRGAYFTVTVDFLDAASHRVEQGTWDEFVGANETVDVRVNLSSPGVAAKVDHCEAEPHATVN
ncbi:hypothetical protein [Streptomyces sp. NPDC059861]|uniref:hypothetical protein n=1 Tax=Streptomyces sp. NPDC059861 TaxID=3346974 RepID=UPI003654490D